MTHQPKFRHVLAIAGIAAAAGLLAGCGDPMERMLASADQRAKLVAAVKRRPDSARPLFTELASNDTTRAVVMEGVLASGPARQELLVRAARDQGLLDGILTYAAQDPQMRAHVTSLVQGMTLGGPPNP